MRRTFASSVFALPIASRAVASTMPSVGISAVGPVQLRSVSASSRATTFCCQSTARLLVRTTLVSCTLGRAMPESNSATSILAP